VSIVVPCYKLAQCNARDLTEAEEIRPRVYVNLGDRQYRDCEFDKAKEIIRDCAPTLSIVAENWAKYVLLRAGRFGVGFRELCAMAAARHRNRWVLGSEE